MEDLTEDGARAVEDLARRHGLSPAAVTQMARAVAAGGGSMAPFNIPELGGGGQWMSGGMTMVGDMFNRGLQAQVASLCADLADLLSRTSLFRAAPGGAGAAWWPADLGAPAQTGGQNTVRYAHFPQARRIAVDDGFSVRVLDTLDHRIGGFSQQQSGPGDPFLGIGFSSQYGQFALATLPLAPEAGALLPERPVPTPQSPAPQNSDPQNAAPWTPTEAPTPWSTPGAASAGDILATIAQLAQLRDAGALTDAEFTAKKTDLLARL